MKKFLYFVLLHCSSLVFAQNNVIQTGNWDATATWQGGNIADVVTENVGFSASATATVQSGFTYTVGSVALGSNGNLSIVGTLNVGNSTNTKNLTGNTGRSITLSGSLTIWGDLILGDNSSIISSGTLVVKGNIVMGNSSSITNSGNMTVSGNFTGGTSTAVVASAPITITGDIVVGTSSSLTKSIGVTVSANSCSGPAAFCTNVLPVKLIGFSCRQSDNAVALSWKTILEKNFDYFEIEKALEGTDFIPIGTVQGSGYDLFNIETSYIFEDRFPTIGKNYYRLRIVDLDGYTEYSAIVMTTWDGEQRINVWPNPSLGDNINIELNYIPRAEDSFLVLNSFGQQLFELHPGANQSKITLPITLRSGAYILKFSGTEEHAVKFWVR